MEDFHYMHVPEASDIVYMYVSIQGNNNKNDKKTNKDAMCLSYTHHKTRAITLGNIR